MGGGQFQSWWIDKRKKRLQSQINCLPTTLPENYSRYTLAYIKIENIDVDDYCNHFLKYLGG